MSDFNATPMGSKLSTVGKLFLAATAGHLAGRTLNMKVRGSQEQIMAVQRVLELSKKFSDELRNPQASVESVIGCLRERNKAAREFERVLGIRWPL